MSQPPPVRCELVDGIAILTLDRPAKRNALSSEVLQGLKDQLERIARDPQARVVILRAAGPVFSAGHDLGELEASGEAELRSLFALCTQVMEAIRLLPKPVIAQVHGLATAAGCQLVASCDLVVASEQASFATPGVKIGLFCTTPGVALARAVGSKKALEMLFTGTPISAQEAERAGLVNQVVPQEQLEVATLDLARRILTASSRVLAAGKRAFHAQLPLDRPAAYALAEPAMVEGALAPEAREGIRAFLEKRPPRWPER